MAKAKSKKPSSRVKPKRPAEPAAKAAARTKSVKPIAKAKSAKRSASKPKSAKAIAKTKSAKSPARAKAAATLAPKAEATAKPKSTPVRKAQVEKPAPPMARAKPRPPQIGRDWSATLFLPKTDFPMKA